MPTVGSLSCKCDTIERQKKSKKTLSKGKWKNLPIDIWKVETKKIDKPK
jgi:hypothetical protein